MADHSEEQDLPPQIQQALVLRAAGASWIDSAAGAGVDVRNLRKWRKHPQSEPFLNEQIRGNLQQAQTLFAEAAPKLAERLIKLALDERVKGYTAVSAISEAFKILQTSVVDQQQREQIEAIKAQLTALEVGMPDVIDVKCASRIFRRIKADHCCCDLLYFLLTVEHKKSEREGKGDSECGRDIEVPTLHSSADAFGCVKDERSN